MKVVDCIADTRHDDPDAHGLHFPSEAWRHVPGASEPRGARLRTSSTPGTASPTPGQLGRLLRLGADPGRRRRRLPGGPGQRPHRRQGARQVHPCRSTALSVRRVPADAGSYRGCGYAGRLHQTRSARRRLPRSPSAPVPTCSSSGCPTSTSTWSRTRTYWDKADAGRTSTRSTCRSSPAPSPPDDVPRVPEGRPGLF